MLHLPLVVFAAAALFGWGSWAVVIYQLSPFASPQWALSLFFLSFFVALTATFGGVMYVFRLFRTKGHLPSYNPINISLRQGAMISFVICLAAFFQRIRVLTWWNILFLIAILLLLEFYLMRE